MRKSQLAFVFALPLVFAAGSANAALDPSVTAAINTGVADAATLGGLVLALVVGIAIFKHVRGAK